MENSLSAQGIHLLPCSTSLPSGIVSLVALEQHKHGWSNPSAGQSSVPADPQGTACALQDGEAAGDMRHSAVSQQPRPERGDVPTARLLPRGRGTTNPCHELGVHQLLLPFHPLLPRTGGSGGSSQAGSPSLTLRSPAGICGRSSLGDARTCCHSCAARLRRLESREKGDPSVLHSPRGVSCVAAVFRGLASPIFSPSSGGAEWGRAGMHSLAGKGWEKH